MINHKNHCSIVLTGKCNCRQLVRTKRVERWIADGRVLTLDVNEADETVICAYENLAALLRSNGLVKE